MEELSGHLYLPFRTIGQDWREESVVLVLRSSSEPCGAKVMVKEREEVKKKT